MSPPLHESLRKGLPAGQPSTPLDVGKFIEGGSGAPESGHPAPGYVSWTTAVARSPGLNASGRLRLDVRLRTPARIWNVHRRADVRAPARVRRGGLPGLAEAARHDDRPGRARGCLEGASGGSVRGPGSLAHRRGCPRARPGRVV